MTELHLQIIVLIVVVLVMIVYQFKEIRPFENERRTRLEKFWLRSCTGSEWRRAFPKESKESIRAFLECFVDGFAFSNKKRLKFNPNDKIMDVYRALYPNKNWPDALELETFSMLLQKRYRLDLEKVFTDELTLGQIFEMTTEANPNQALRP